MSDSTLVRISKAHVAFFIVLSLLYLVSAEPSVDISITPIQPKFGQLMRVTCLVSGITDPDYFRLKVKFLCPVVDKNVACFQDCKSSCATGAGCGKRRSDLLADITCKSFRGTDKFQFDYEFPFRDYGYAGNYMCQFYGRLSARVNVARPIMPPTTLRPTTTTKRTTTTTTTTRKPTTTTRRKVPSKPIQTTVKPYEILCKNQPTVEPEVDVHRERIIVVIMVLLFCSVAANIVIVVRCVVKSHYIKYPHKKRMSTFLCLNLDRPGVGRPHSASLPYAASVGLSAIDDAAGSDSTYSMPNAAFMPMSGHGRASTLPVIPNSDSQNIVFIPVITNSLGTLQSASHPRLNSPLPDNVSMGDPSGGGGGHRRHESPAVPARDYHRLSTSSIHLRPKVPPHPPNGVVREESIDPEAETLID